MVKSGFPITTVARTCFDLIGDPDPGLRHSPDGRGLHAVQMGRVLNDALARRGLTLGQLAVVQATVAKRGRPGSALARELLTTFGPKYTPTQSDGESFVAQLIEELSLPEPARQVPMSDEQGWIGTVDFVWPTALLILEIDGVWHDGPLDQEQDAIRDDRLRELGYDIWRWRYQELLLSTARFMRQLRLRLELRGETGAIAPVSTQHSPEGEVS
jgi:very-short-patch-repair endonuclease